jgi:hypothetical protein
MRLMKYFVAGVRTFASAIRLCPWKEDSAMIQFRESDLEKAYNRGYIPEQTLTYARGIIELRVQGKPVAKTRKQWADYMCGGEEARAGKLSTRGFPFRSYDSHMTKGVHLHRALLELEAMNKANPDVPLEELVANINERGCWHL